MGIPGEAGGSPQALLTMLTLPLMHGRVSKNISLSAFVQCVSHLYLSEGKSSFCSRVSHRYNIEEAAFGTTCIGSEERGGERARALGLFGKIGSLQLGSLVQFF